MPETKQPTLEDFKPVDKHRKRTVKDLSDYKDVQVAPHDDPLALIHWVQRVAALALYQQLHRRASAAFREAVRKTCDDLATVLPAFALAAARNEDVEGVDMQLPPPTDPLKCAVYGTRTLVTALEQLIGGTWGRDDNYRRLASLRQHVKTVVKVVPPEIELEARETFRRMKTKISKRGNSPPLDKTGPGKKRRRLRRDS